MENLKQYSDCKFECIKCEEQLTVEKEVWEHMDAQATECRLVSDGREADILNTSLFFSQGEEDLKKSKLDCKFACKLCERRNYDERNLKKHYLKQHKYYLHINDDLADAETAVTDAISENSKIALECELSTSDQHIQGHSEFIGSDSMQNLKQYSDCKFSCIKCEKQLTVEKNVEEHVDPQATKF